MSKIPGEIIYSPIGVIRSPHKDIEGMPIQPTAAKGIRGTVEINKKYAAGLKDLDGFEYIILLYHFHLSKGYTLEIKPFLDDSLRGVFATRAPKRPNAIGISIVRLLKVEGITLHIEDVDILDGTPLLDIKPYVPQFDVRETRTIGWLSRKAVRAVTKKADGRFR
jgi:tRNA-Thr(GGU) m(6)t(6)A37 methyltransferase TsaA